MPGSATTSITPSCSRNLGCSSNAARICELYLTDNLHFKRDFKLVDGSLSEVVNFVLGHTGLQAESAGALSQLVPHLSQR